MSKKIKILIQFFIFSLILSSSLIFAADSETSISTSMVNLIFQLSFIIIAAWLGGYLFKKIKLQSVLGEIFAGMIIGPYCLGQIKLPGFEHGIFPIANSSFPISPELYSYATVASILLLFLVGLETDMKTFFKYSLAGLIVGLSGVVFSFVLGDILGIIFAKYALGLDYGFLDIMPLFLGIISTATSVGITARILSEKKKMNSPEGVTILAAAVIDDVLGIILLAVVIGIAKSGHIAWGAVSAIALKAVGIWLVFSALGLIFAYKISKALKLFKDKFSISIMAVALAMFLAGFFEKSGLTMIVGAYITGLSLSKTDISLMIQENLGILQKFLIPVFFCVMGMLVDISQMGSPIILTFGLLYLLFAVAGKVIGCMLPSYFLNFNNIGALRVGVGMIPRGEVALIIVGIGLAAGVLTKEIFSIALIMTFLTTLITPPILDKLFSIPKTGVKSEKKNISDEKKEEIIFKMPNEETQNFILPKIIEHFEEEGYFVHNLDIQDKIYQIRRETHIISFKVDKENSFVFDCLENEAPFIYTMFYEVLGDLENTISNLQKIANKEKIVGNIFHSTKEKIAIETKLKNLINQDAITIDLKSNSKNGILGELLDLLVEAKRLSPDSKETILQELINREQILTTGMQNFIALPHVRTDTVDSMLVAIGIKKSGVDFQAIDGNLSKFFILTLAPKNSQEPYLKFMSEIAQMLAHENIQDFLNVSTNLELYEKLLK